FTRTACCAGSAWPSGACCAATPSRARASTPCRPARARPEARSNGKASHHRDHPVRRRADGVVEAGPAPRAARRAGSRHLTGEAAFRTTFPGASFPAPGGSWQVSRPAADVVSFVAENADVRVEKRYHADTTRYRLHLDVFVQNKTDKNQDHHLALALAGRQDP